MQEKIRTSHINCEYFEYHRTEIAICKKNNVSLKNKLITLVNGSKFESCISCRNWEMKQEESCKKK